MAIAPRDQTRQIGTIQVLAAPPRPAAVGLGDCLAVLQGQWKRDGNLVALWQAWPRIAGSQLAPHCQPLHLQAGVLSVGASHPQWLQALRYNRHQLLGALRGAGFSVRDLRFQQHFPGLVPTPGAEAEALVWAVHPSRVDVHGVSACPRCGSPAPAGELGRWGQCSFCHRQDGGLSSARGGDPSS
ncbi:DUF721 domain-containing protein [Synechococcus sp. CS-602]|uniref:DUF721 domain-containing protein n=1 Tax=Synechococcaceae TaxID=1890426 RepID=UPI0008FF5289|nr:MULTISPECIES: DUF721 domain-containing protein [Synechococcaceae]MCT4365564.1 DUF721 domain-containing protein [Candidatus Regnicoccus frigidus MAG-AL1]APD47435.1 hypothetical protein BM449_02920 [Synechococcus sp. SynAce01]MCT0202630.1 DUF721 domain-containing protein [Synechococcus sp. CS-603]MCT0204434.1 DUF721 domain-containing protein [Synechococcus sp. CS-602]MCT0247276.1 DUF721 domain-containing protein [Synechococcus sp. CS-601]